MSSLRNDIMSFRFRGYRNKDRISISYDIFPEYFWKQE